MLSRLLFIVILNWSIFSVSYAAEVVFMGHPEIKVLVDGETTEVIKLEESDIAKYRTVIIKDGEKYYWVSRENRELVKIESGAYDIYQIIGGTSYIKIIKPGMKKAVTIFPGSEAEYNYVEEHTLGFKLIIYYGN